LSWIVSEVVGLCPLMVAYGFVVVAAWFVFWDAELF